MRYRGEHSHLGHGDCLRRKSRECRGLALASLVVGGLIAGANIYFPMQQGDSPDLLVVIPTLVLSLLACLFFLYRSVACAVDAEVTDFKDQLTLGYWVRQLFRRFLG